MVAMMIESSLEFNINKVCFKDCSSLFQALFLQK